jgi:hypothetical protein
LAGITLQRQALVPHNRQHHNNVIPENGGLPFLYHLPGTVGFAPIASKWLDFLDFAECALASEMSLDIEELATTEWDDKQQDEGNEWTHMFTYFATYYSLYTLHVHTPNSTAMATQMEGKGANL